MADSPPITQEEAINRLLLRGRLERALRGHSSYHPDSLGDRITRCLMHMNIPNPAGGCGTDENRALAEELILEAANTPKT